MKRVLITGEHSYIGESVENYLHENYPKSYKIDTISVKGDDWKNYDFSKYDTIFHVAGIAHSDNGKITEEKKKLYYAVNTDLTIDVAKKAKKDGAKQFIFMSSAIVYGESAKIGKDKLITKDTPVSPKNCYGDSKVQAENGIKKLDCDKFKVVILRPPMIYGKGCKGNFQSLVEIADKLPVFPYVNNQRSMLYVENLAEFIHLAIKNNEQGTFWPANNEYSNTSELVQKISIIKGKKTRLIKGFTPLIKLAGLFSQFPNKAFGNLRYDSELTKYKTDYRVNTLENSIEKSL
ncbi:NAD-dependent epimerase/dehydratase family protein [Candidatus Saccharibacteria bacterium]|nr:NAD-dependent epimerase/dehydratase family protein [Candidatus Saccharibacteria bacterium]